LLRDDYPILFEGLHTCFYLDDPRLKNRFKIYRESNIEHHYYQHLFRDEKNLFKKLFFAIESLRLKQYQKVLKHADLMLVVSQSDTDYLKKHFPNKQVEYLPSFHPNDDFSVIPGMGDYVLYHGKLSVTENYKAAEYLIKNIFSEVPHKLVIAGMDPPQHLQELCSKHENVELIINPEDAEMFSLIQNAQANILITFQATGLKLKLLNTLYKGRFCIVNPEMVQGTGLEKLCEVGKNDQEIIQKIEDVMQREFDMAEIEKRKSLLLKYYSNSLNAQKLLSLAFPK
jgi:predicted nucleic acid-binding protein